MDAGAIGPLLVQARSSLGLTQMEVGRRLRVGKARVSQLEQLADTAVTAPLANRLSAAYGIPIAQRARRSSTPRRELSERLRIGERLRLVLEGDDSPVWEAGMDASTQYRLQRGGAGTVTARATGSLARLLRRLRPAASAFVEGGRWVLIRDLVFARAFDRHHTHPLAKTLAPLLMITEDVADDALLDRRLSEAIAKVRGPWSVDHADRQRARRSMLAAAARQHSALAQFLFFARPVRLGWYSAQLDVWRVNVELLDLSVEIVSHPHDAPPRAWWVKKLPRLTRRGAQRLAFAIAGPGAQPRRLAVRDRAIPPFHFLFYAIG